MDPHKRPNLKAVILLTIPFIFFVSCGNFARIERSEHSEAEKQQLARRAEAQRLLSSYNPAIRQNAALELLSSGEDEALAIIEEKISGPANPEVKVDILKAISFRADRRCFELVLKSIQDPHQEVKEAAASALVNFSHPQDIDSLISYTRSPNRTPEEVKLLFHAMGEGIFVNATPVLIDGLRSGKESVKEAAWEALYLIWDRKLPASPEHWEKLWQINQYRTRAEILEERLKASETSLEALKRQIRSLEQELREFSELAMSEQRKSPVSLLNALKSNNTLVMEYAAFLLNHMSKEELEQLDLDKREFYSELSGALNEGPPKVQIYIAEIIEHLQGAYRKDLLLDALQLNSSEAIITAISAVSQNPDRQVAGRLEELLHHANAKVREAAANVLSRSQEDTTVPALRNALKDTEPNVRWFAVESLRKLKAQSAVPDLTDLVENDPSPLVREISATTLGELAQPGAFPSLRKALGDDSRRVREQAARALITLAEHNLERTLVIGEALVNQGFTSEAKQVMSNALQGAGEADNEVDEAEISKQVLSLKIKIADRYSIQEMYSEALEIYERLLETPEQAAEARKKIFETRRASGDLDGFHSDYIAWLDEADEELQVNILNEGAKTVRELLDTGEEEVAERLLETIKGGLEELTSPPEELVERIGEFEEEKEPETEQEAPSEDEEEQEEDHDDTES